MIGASYRYRFRYKYRYRWGFLDGSVVKNPPANVGDMGLLPGSGRSPGGGNGNPFQYSCLGNPMDRRPWWAAVYRVSKTQTQFSSVQSLSHVRFFATPWTAARQDSLSITTSQSLLKLMSIESVMPSNQLIFCHPLLLLPSMDLFLLSVSSPECSPYEAKKVWSILPTALCTAPRRCSGSMC